MRMFAQDRALCRRLRVDGTDDPEALRRLGIVEGVDRMSGRFTAVVSMAIENCTFLATENCAR